MSQKWANLNFGIIRNRLKNLLMKQIFKTKYDQFHNLHLNENLSVTEELLEMEADTTCKGV